MNARRRRSTTCPTCGIDMPPAQACFLGSCWLCHNDGLCQDQAPIP